MKKTTHKKNQPKKRRIIAISVSFVFIVLLIAFFTMVTKAANLSITALGTSITEQGGASSTGWLQKYKSSVNVDLFATSTVNNLGIQSLQSLVLLDKVNNDQNFINAISGANIITLEIGINDFLTTRGSYLSGTCGGPDNQDCLRNMVSNFQSNFSGTVNRIKTLNSGNTAIRSMDIYYSVSQTDQASGNFTVLNNYLNQMNSYINSYSASNGILVAQVHTAFNGSSGTEDPVAKGYILPDGVHPSVSGHSVIHTSIKSLGYSPIEPDYCKADVNRSGQVNVIDLYATAAHVNMPYDPTYDMDSNGNISVIDVQKVAAQNGRTCPTSASSIKK